MKNIPYNGNLLKLSVNLQFIVVTRYGQDPLRVYPYVAMIENVIYGAMEVNQMVFENAITLFGRLFQDITGSNYESSNA